MASALNLATLTSKPCLAPRKQSRSLKCQAADRPLWLPGIKPPAHLKGELIGDFGYDPLNLGKDPDALRWYVQAELIHGRLAMMGLAGMLVPSALTKAGILNTPEWYEAGKVAIEGSDIPFGMQQKLADVRYELSVAALLSVQLLLAGWVETKRWMDFRKPKSQGEAGSFLGLEGLLAGSGENAYPGGIFDPFNFSKGSNLDELKLKEIKNGRLAMFACLGFYAQAVATGKGPVDNWIDHISDPWANNFATNGVSLPFL